MTRAERVTELARLTESGMTVAEAARQMGISHTYAYALRHDPTGDLERERKQKYMNRCIDCGKTVWERSSRCRSCGQKVAAKKRTRWTRERIIEALQWWNQEHGSPPSIVDWNPWKLDHIWGGEQRAAYTRQQMAEGRVPWFTHVIREFGSWNNAIITAGLTPRPSGGPPKKQQRRFINGRPQEGNP